MSLALGKYLTDPPPVSRTRRLTRISLSLLGHHLTENRKDELPIVAAFDVGKRAASGLISGSPSFLVSEFQLEDAEKLSMGELS